MPEQPEPDQQTIAAAVSWSVEYGGITCDDARRVAGVWYYRDVLTGNYLRFPFQQRVVPLFENDSSR